MQKRNWLSIILMCLLSTSMACAPSAVNEISSVPPTQTTETTFEKATPSPTTVLQDTPVLPAASVLFEGVVVFQVELSSSDNANAVFDFDLNEALVPDEQNRNDVMFIASGGTNIFLTISPLNNALGFALESGDIALRSFAFEECFLQASEFGSSRAPIHPGQFFCWQTSEGNFAEFAINDVHVKENIFYIEVKYIVWSVSG